MLTKTSLTVAALLFSAALALDTQAAGYKKADKMGAGIAEFRDEIVDVKKAVDTSLASLSQVVASAAENPRKPYEKFADSVDKIDAATAKARKRSEEMKERGQAYFKQWEKELSELTDPDVRKLADERKTKLQATFGQIRTAMEPARDQFNAWLADLKDLQKFLANDLTIGGIDSAKELIAKTKTEGAAVQQTLDKVIAELNTIAATVTPAKSKK